ncbi:MAG: hypothetical protein KGZ39_01925 [Simkania sp.]|nr:hypothetical protein [Simkania sp.]
MKTSEGFVKLYREAFDLLKDSRPAFLLLLLIGFRAKRIDPTYSVHKLKVNEAFLGDYGIIGLTRSEYRTAIEKLEKDGLVKFQATPKGTIATLINTALLDINAESDDRAPLNSHLLAIEQPTFDQEIATLSPSEKPSKLSIESQDQPPSEKPTDRHQIAFRPPSDSQLIANKPPLTKKEEKEEEKRAAAASSRTVYKCLDGLDFSDQEKLSLMCYSEHRVAHAAEFVRRKQNVDSPIGLMMWVCQQPSLPELPRESRKNVTPQQKLAWEYNQFLINNGYAAQAKQNEEKIPNDRMVILEHGQPMPITLNNPLQILQEDFRKSKEEILKSQRIVRGLKGDKL